MGDNKIDMNKLKYKDIVKDLNKLASLGFKRLIKDEKDWLEKGGIDPVLHFENSPFETHEENINYFITNYSRYLIDRRGYDMVYHDTDTHYYLSVKKTSNQDILALFNTVNEITSLVIIFK
jgi:hypothetical protein